MYIVYLLYNQDNKWFGTGLGLYKFDGTNWSVIYDGGIIGIENYIFHDYTTTNVAVDKNGTVWAVSSHGYLKRFDGVNWTEYYLGIRKGPESHMFYNVTIDDDNNVWINSSRGLMIFDEKNWKMAKKYNNEPYDIFAFDTTTNCQFINETNSKCGSLIYIDRHKRKWFTSSEGITKFDGATWTTYNISNSGLQSNSILQVVVDKEDNEWFIYNNGYNNAYGTTRFDGKNWVTYTMQNSGIGGNKVVAVAIDSNNYKWFGIDDNSMSPVRGISILTKEPHIMQ